MNDQTNDEDDGDDLPSVAMSPALVEAMDLSPGEQPAEIAPPVDDDDQ